ncbi:MAG: hypothetical protein ACJARX_000341 [Psychroserpens sp.]|jgi:hypothetical protein
MKLANKGWKKNYEDGTVSAKGVILLNENLV